jgi:hypothetical protein
MASPRSGEKAEQEITRRDKAVSARPEEGVAAKLI